MASEKRNSDNLLPESNAESNMLSILQSPKKRAHLHSATFNSDSDLIEAGFSDKQGASHFNSSSPSESTKPKISADNTKTQSSQVGPKVLRLSWAEVHRRNIPLPMIPTLNGGTIHPYTCSTPSNSAFRNLWLADCHEFGKALNVQFRDANNDRYEIWPEPTDWEIFGKYPRSGRKNLARAEDFLAFCIWDYKARTLEYVTKRISLSTLLEMFLCEDNPSRYQKYLATPILDARRWDGPNQFLSQLMPEATGEYRVKQFDELCRKLYNEVVLDFAEEIESLWGEHIFGEGTDEMWDEVDENKMNEVLTRVQHMPYEEVARRHSKMA